jgi:hypothetical protein
MSKISARDGWGTGAAVVGLRRVLQGAVDRFAASSASDAGGQ